MQPCATCPVILPSKLLSDGSRLFEHGCKLSLLVERVYASHGAVVTPTHELPIDPDSGNRGAAHERSELGPQRRAICHFVELHDLILGAKTIQQCFGLDAERSGSKREHQYRLLVNEAEELCFGGRFVIVTCEHFHERLFPLV